MSGRHLPKSRQLKLHSMSSTTISKSMTSSTTRDRDDSDVDIDDDVDQEEKYDPEYAELNRSQKLKSL